MSELRDNRGLTEAEAIERYRAKNYPKPALTADIAVFAGSEAGLKLLLIRRGGHPFLGCWALPGGFADEGETIEQTAARELQEETGLTGLQLSLVGIYSAPGRDPRGWTVSAAYAVCVDAGELRAEAGDDAAEARWFDVRNGDVILAEGERLAFDHRQIINDAAKCIILPNAKTTDR
jgi:ADP-ribose pyrophosphatase YjhB (NUDIX family)